VGTIDENFVIVNDVYDGWPGSAPSSDNRLRRGCE
jgi:hypothetical protein